MKKYIAAAVTLITLIGGSVFNKKSKKNSTDMDKTCDLIYTYNNTKLGEMLESERALTGYLTLERIDVLTKENLQKSLEEVRCYKEWCGKRGVMKDNSFYMYIEDTAKVISSVE